MMADVNPGLILILGSLLLPLLPHALRGLLALALPLIAAAHLYALQSAPDSIGGIFQVAGFTLETIRLDGLSLPFAIVFLIAAFLSALYSMHERGWIQPMTAMMYAGSALGAVLAGDLITMLVFWELTAITSVFLIWARNTEGAFAAGMRYLLLQVTSGLLLLAGLMIIVHGGGAIAFDKIATLKLGALDTVPLEVWLIFLAFGVKAAFPLLHTWLPDAYPAATVTGTVWLSAFTTKLAIYALARGFPGSDVLIFIGAAMAVIPIIFAVLADDLRRVLAYALMSQLGFMVIGIGVGTELSINGAVAHAFASTIYQSLLFMSIGAVLLRTGSARASDLGGLASSMPWTAGFCIIGAMSIAAMPLFSGFVTKSLIMSAAAKQGYMVGWIAMMIASACVVLHAGIKVPYFTFYRPTRNVTCKEAPFNMLLAMALTAALCLAIGMYPDPLYRILPHAVAYEPYTLAHIVEQLQLLGLAALAFVIVLRLGLFPLPKPSTTIDADWLTRVAGYKTAAVGLALATALWNAITGGFKTVAFALERNLNRTHNPDGILGRTWSTGVMAFWATLMLAVYLALFYLR